MSEIGGGDDDGKEMGGSGQESGNETESASLQRPHPRWRIPAPWKAPALLKG